MASSFHLFSESTTMSSSPSSHGEGDSHPLSVSLYHAVAVLQHTWKDIGLSTAEQQTEWEAFLHNGLEPLVQNWMATHLETRGLLMNYSDGLLRYLLWLVIKLDEAPQEPLLEKLIATLRSYIQQHPLTSKEARKQWKASSVALKGASFSYSASSTDPQEPSPCGAVDSAEGKTNLSAADLASMTRWLPCFQAYASEAGLHEILDEGEMSDPPPNYTSLTLDDVILALSVAIDRNSQREWFTRLLQEVRRLHRIFQVRCSMCTILDKLHEFCESIKEPARGELPLHVLQLREAVVLCGTILEGLRGYTSSACSSVEKFRLPSGLAQEEGGETLCAATGSFSLPVSSKASDTAGLAPCQSPASSGLIHVQSSSTGASLTNLSVDTERPSALENEWNLFMNTSIVRGTVEERGDARYSYLPLHIPTPDRRTVASPAELLERSKTEPITNLKTVNSAATLSEDLYGLLNEVLSLSPPLQELIWSSKASNGESLLRIGGKIVQQDNPAGEVSAASLHNCAKSITFCGLEDRIRKMREWISSTLMPQVKYEMRLFNAVLQAFFEVISEDQEKLSPVGNGSEEPPFAAVRELWTLLENQLEIEVEAWERRDYQFLWQLFPSEMKRFLWVQTVVECRKSIAQNFQQIETICQDSSDASIQDQKLLIDLQHVVIGLSCLTPALRSAAPLAMEQCVEFFTRSHQNLLKQKWKALNEISERYVSATDEDFPVLPPSDMVEHLQEAAPLLAQALVAGLASCCQTSAGLNGEVEGGTSVSDLLAGLLEPLRSWIKGVKQMVTTLCSLEASVERKLHIITEAEVLIKQRKDILEAHQRLLAVPGGSRLLNKRVNMAKQLLEEEQARRKASRELPSIMKKLSRLVEEWEGIQAAGSSPLTIGSAPHPIDTSSDNGVSAKQGRLAVHGVVVQDLLASHVSDLAAHGIRLIESHGLGSGRRKFSFSPEPKAASTSLRKSTPPPTFSSSHSPTVRRDMRKRCRSQSPTPLKAEAPRMRIKRSSTVSPIPGYAQSRQANLLSSSREVTKLSKASRGRWSVQSSSKPMSRVSPPIAISTGRLHHNKESSQSHSACGTIPFGRSPVKAPMNAAKSEAKNGLHHAKSPSPVQPVDVGG